MGYQYSIKQLIKVKKWFDTNPDGMIDIPGMWPELRLSKSDWHDWFIKCLNEKINSNDYPRRDTWRKMDYDYWCEMRRAQTELNYRGKNGSKLVIHWLPKDLKTRFADRLYDERY